MRGHSEISVGGAALSRRGFLAAGGALMVSLSVKSHAAPAGQPAAVDPTKSASWIEIHADNTILIRTGKCDFGQSSIYTAYPQLVAEELGVPFEAITSVISGDTDRTPDGGGTFGLMHMNGLNLRKAAAYTREAVLELASQRFGVPREQISVADGVVSGGNKSATYGQLVAGQDLRLAIPVKGKQTDFLGVEVIGEPPLKPASAFAVIGKPYKNPSVRPKMSGKTMWVGDVKLPGMLHARVVHPATLGSKLIAAGKVDESQFPGARVVVIGNLVAVVSESEWQAVQAAMQVAADTKWSDWKGLPGSERLLDHLSQEVKWDEVPTAPGSRNQGDVAAAVAKTHIGSYFVPFLKHAPIGPTVSLADVRPDGSVILHTHSQNPQYLRFSIAKMLGKPEDAVVIRTYAGPSHFGRSNGGNAGSEDEAVLLSRELGRPVRLQWMRADDMKWSTQSSPIYSEISIGLDKNGRIASYRADHKLPPEQDDRLIGAVLAGLPAIDPPSPNGSQPALTRIIDPWAYGAVPNVAETGHGTYQIGQRASPIAVGLRDHSMRTPTQYQQNFAREVAMTEAAALAGSDPLQFRIDHVTDERFKNILIRLREESGWVTRPIPAAGAKSDADGVVRGQGVSMIVRDNGYWACAVHVAITPATGEVRVERLTIVVEPGIIANPLQLRRQAQGGGLMGVSMALHEEVAFDESGVTSEDWSTYPILTMAEMPDVKVVLMSRPDLGIFGTGSETPNSLAPPAIAGAFLDATGKPARRIPLRPDYVKAMLNG